MPDHLPDSNEDTILPGSGSCSENDVSESLDQTIAPLGSDGDGSQQQTPLHESGISAAEKLAAYTDRKEIGTWQFGKVYQANHPKLARKVNLLVLDERFSHDEGIRSQFLNRARSVATIVHPNVETGIWEAVDADEVVYVAFEPTSAVPVAALGPRSESEKEQAWFYDNGKIAKTLSQCMAGVTAIHEAGLSHGSIDANCIRKNSDSESIILSGLVASNPVAADISDAEIRTQDLRDLGLAFASLLCGANQKFETCSNAKGLRAKILAANEEMASPVLDAIQNLVFPDTKKRDHNRTLSRLIRRKPAFALWAGRIGTMAYEPLSILGLGLGVFGLFLTIWSLPIVALSIFALHFLLEVVFAINIGRRVRGLQLLGRSGVTPRRTQLFYRWLIRWVAVIALGILPTFLTLFALRIFGVEASYWFTLLGFPLGILLTWCTGFFLPFGRPVHDSLSGVTLCTLSDSNPASLVGQSVPGRSVSESHKLPPASADKLAGQKIGQYEIVRELGRGGMGTVYSANDSTLDRKVAVKLVAPHLVSATDTLQRFEREAMLAAQLSHDNVARVLGVGDHEGAPWLAMEYVEGQDLGALVKKTGPVPVQQAWDYVVQAATGLKAVNDLGIIHRDIKPANLMLDESGNIKVMDFGISKRVGDSDFHIENNINALDIESGLTRDLTQLGQMMGTPMYMSPEQAKSQELTTASDIYSLGLTLYTLLTGKLPYESHDTIDLISKQVSEDPDFNSGLIPELAPAQLAVLRGMIAKDVESRYQDYDSLLHDLELTRRADPVPATLNERLSAFLTLTAPIEIFRAALVVSFDFISPGDVRFTAYSTVAIYLVLYPAICILGIWRFGMTPGHWFCGLRVVSDDGGKVSLLESAIRYAACFPYAFGVVLVWLSHNMLFANAGFLFWIGSMLLIHLTPSRQAIHDFAVGTKVVKEESLVAPDQLVHQAVKD